MADDVRVNPGNELPVTVGLRGRRIYRISLWGHYPPLLDVDLEYLKKSLHGTAPNLEDSIRAAWTEAQRCG